MAKHRTPAPRAQRGETLAEVLISLLIVALATLLLASVAVATANINADTRQKDETFYDALGKVEAMDNTVLATPAPVGASYQAGIWDAGAGNTPLVTPYPVDVYTSEDLTLYKKKP